MAAAAEDGNSPPHEGRFLVLIINHYILFYHISQKF